MRMESLDLIFSHNSLVRGGGLKIIEQNGIPELEVRTVLENKDQFELIDVRTPEEFNGELGHISGSKLVTLGPDLLQYLENSDKNQKVIFICRSGGRSGQATMVSQQMGLHSTYNMIGGMLEWNRQQLPTANE